MAAAVAAGAAAVKAEYNYLTAAITAEFAAEAAEAAAGGVPRFLP